MTSACLIEFIFEFVRALEHSRRCRGLEKPYRNNSKRNETLDKVAALGQLRNN